MSINGFSEIDPKGQDFVSQPIAPDVVTLLLEPDRDQLERFVGNLFRYAEGEGFFSVRAFFDNEPESKPFRIQSVPLAAGLPYLIAAAEDVARRAANEPKRIVFCPPLGAFSNPKQAREQDLLAGFCLSVECDEHPRQALATLAAIIGPPTMIVRSGGRWTDPATGQAHDKLHLHWRLARPARGDDLPKLKRARELATRIVGGDASNIPTVHPIRWPGSWHRKGDPVLCEIEDADPDREIDLSAALELLEPAAPTPPLQGSGAATLAAILNDGRADWAELTANIIAGRNLHESTASLAASHAALGMSAEHSLRTLRSLMLTSTAPHDERWQARMNDLPNLVRSGQEKFGAVAEAPAPPVVLCAPYVSRDPATLPRRGWIYGKHYIRQYVSASIGEGGIGKSTVALTEAVIMITRRPLLGKLPLAPKQLRVWYWNGEDPKIEIELRLAAICQRFGIDGRELEGRLFIDGRDSPISIAAMNRSGAIQLDVPVIQAITERIKQNSVDVLMLDPFVSCHRVSENDNMAIDQVIKALGRIAEEANCAIDIDHHTRKPSPGQEGLTISDTRGGSAIVNGVRSGRIFNQMTARRPIRLASRRKTAKAILDTTRPRPTWPRLNSPYGTSWCR